MTDSVRLANRAINTLVLDDLDVGSPAGLLDVEEHGASQNTTPLNPTHDKISSPEYRQTWHHVLRKSKSRIDDMKHVQRRRASLQSALQRWRIRGLHSGDYATLNFYQPRDGTGALTWSRLLGISDPNSSEQVVTIVVALILGVRERTEKLVHELVLDYPTPFVPSKGRHMYLCGRDGAIDFRMDVCAALSPLRLKRFGGVLVPEILVGL